MCSTIASVPRPAGFGQFCSLFGPPPGAASPIARTASAATAPSTATEDNSVAAPVSGPGTGDGDAVAGVPSAGPINEYRQATTRVTSFSVATATAGEGREPGSVLIGSVTGHPAASTVIRRIEPTILSRTPCSACTRTSTAPSLRVVRSPTSPSATRNEDAGDTSAKETNEPALATRFAGSTGPGEAIGQVSSAGMPGRTTYGA